MAPASSLPFPEDKVQGEKRPPLLTNYKEPGGCDVLPAHKQQDSLKMFMYTIKDTHTHTHTLQRDEYRWTHICVCVSVCTCAPRVSHYNDVWSACSNIIKDVQTHRKTAVEINIWAGG